MYVVTNLIVLLFIILMECYNTCSIEWILKKKGSWTYGQVKEVPGHGTNIGYRGSTFLAIFCCLRRIQNNYAFPSNITTDQGKESYGPWQHLECARTADLQLKEKKKKPVNNFWLQNC